MRLNTQPKLVNNIINLWSFYPIEGTIVKYRRHLFRKRPRSRTVLPTLLLGLATALVAAPAAVPRSLSRNATAAGIHFAPGVPSDESIGATNPP